MMVTIVLSCSIEQKEEFLTADARFNKGKKAAITTALEEDPTANPVYTDDFADISNWTFIDADGDGQGWNHESFYSSWGMASQSWNMWLPDSNLEPDNWMISPAINLGANTNRLKWDVRVPFWDATNEYYTVYVSTGNTINDFLTSPLSFSELLLHKDQQYDLREVDISQFQGQTVYVAFRHWHNPAVNYNNSRGISELHIDNLIVDENLGYVRPPKFPDGFNALNANSSFTYLQDDPVFQGMVFDYPGETYTLANYATYGGTVDNVGSIIVPRGGIYLASYTNGGVTVEFETTHFTLWYYSP